MTARDEQRVNVEEGRRLLAKATEGPWAAVSMDGTRWGASLNGSQFRFALITSQGNDEANMAAIVWLRNNAAALLDAAERSNAERAVIEAAKAWYDTDDYYEQLALENAVAALRAAEREQESP